MFTHKYTQSYIKNKRKHELEYIIFHFIHTCAWVGVDVFLFCVNKCVIV